MIYILPDYKEKGITQANLRKLAEEFRGHEVPLSEEWSHQTLHAEARKPRALSEDLTVGLTVLPRTSD